MAKKDNDNFDFETGTESKEKFKLDLSFLKNLTKQQKGIILATIVGIVVIAVVVICVIIGANGGNNNDDNGDINSGYVGDGTLIDPDEIAGISISSAPTKTIYNVGDVADYSGLVINIEKGTDVGGIVKYEDDKENFIITGFDSSKIESKQTVTVDYKGFTTTFTVEIKPMDNGNPILERINVIPPNKTTYQKNDPIDVAGGFIEAYYKDVDEPVVVKLKVSNISGYSAIANIPGEHEITVVYSDEYGGYKEAKFTVTIVE